MASTKSKKNKHENAQEEVLEVLSEQDADADAQLRRSTRQGPVNQARALDSQRKNLNISNSIQRDSEEEEEFHDDTQQKIPLRSPSTSPRNQDQLVSNSSIGGASIKNSPDKSADSSGDVAHNPDKKSRRSVLKKYKVQARPPRESSSDEEVGWEDFLDDDEEPNANALNRDKTWLLHQVKDVPIHPAFESISSSDFYEIGIRQDSIEAAYSAQLEVISQILVAAVKQIGPTSVSGALLYAHEQVKVLVGAFAFPFRDRESFLLKNGVHASVFKQSILKDLAASKMKQKSKTGSNKFGRRRRYQPSYSSSSSSYSFRGQQRKPTDQSNL
jgi:hypothetical protein